MKILVINDDGIESPGLWAAVRAVRSVGEVLVVAPRQQQSGVGASLTLHSQVTVTSWAVADEFEVCEPGQNRVTAVAVEGTPGDCCILGLEVLATDAGLVVSGINAGSNVGWDVMVSGTVGGAVQAFSRGRPTIAVSVASVSSPRYDVAGPVLERLAQRLAQGNGQPLFLNLNVPNVGLGQVKGVKATSLGGLSYRESVRLDGTDDGGTKRYWIARNRPGGQTQSAESDVVALRDNHVSITPLRLGMGDDGRLGDVAPLLDGLLR